jgi:hypothetical protein
MLSVWVQGRRGFCCDVPIMMYYFNDIVAILKVNIPWIRKLPHGRSRTRVIRAWVCSSLVPGGYFTSTPSSILTPSTLRRFVPVHSFDRIVFSDTIIVRTILYS